jgi:hypothetical protein
MEMNNTPPRNLAERMEEELISLTNVDKLTLCDWAYQYAQAGDWESKEIIDEHIYFERS